MKIAVIGGTGFIGSRLVRLLRHKGSRVLAASPATGFDTLQASGLEQALAGTEVVVDVANSPTFDESASRSFFETSTRNLLAAEAAAGVRHHVMLSVVGTDRLQDSGYFRGKRVQERLSRASGIPYTILRSTQFFEFLEHLADLFSDGRSIRMPLGVVQPVAADDVVSALAEIALGPPMNGSIELAGPERFRFDQVVQRVLVSRNDPRPVTGDIFARYFGAPLDDETLVPRAGARIAGTRLEAWLRQGGGRERERARREAMIARQGR